MNNLNLKDKLLNDEWKYIQLNVQEKYKINTFDDGNSKYENYTNLWIIYGTWKGKTALVNYINNEILISSISNWKLSKVSMVLMNDNNNNRMDNVNHTIMQ
jgi:hypothetical protein